MGDAAHQSDIKPPPGNPNVWRQVVFGDGWGDDGCLWEEGMVVTIFDDGHVEVYVRHIDQQRNGWGGPHVDVSFEVEIKLMSPGGALPPTPGSWEEMFPLFQRMSYKGHKEDITVPFPPRSYITRNMAQATYFACWRHSNTV